MSRIKPIKKVRDLKAGLPYFVVRVIPSTYELYIDQVFVPTGRVFNLITVVDKEKLPVMEKKGEPDYNGKKAVIFIRDNGIGQYRRGFDNHHRTFRYIGKAYAFMKDIVRRQDLKAYREIIGWKM